MRAQTVNFERGKDPKEAMKVGSFRELTDQALIDAVYDNIYPELKDDPRWKKKEPLITKDYIYNWIVAMVEDPDTGEVRTMWPGEITADMFREYWDEISEPDPDDDFDYDEEWAEENSHLRDEDWD